MTCLKYCWSDLPRIKYEYFIDMFLLIISSLGNAGRPQTWPLTGSRQLYFASVLYDSRNSWSLIQLFRGLDNAGKTTILKKFNGEDVNTISPTLGFNIKTLEHNGYNLNIWDVGGQKSLRYYWRNYFETTDGLIWVVDSADRRRLDDCKKELHQLLQEEVEGILPSTFRISLTENPFYFSVFWEPRFWFLPTSRICPARYPPKRSSRSELSHNSFLRISIFET